MKRTRLNTDQIESALQRIDAGEGLRAVARDIGVTHQCLQHHRRKRGCKNLKTPYATGANHHSWKGGTRADSRDGYTMILCPERSLSSKYAGEHTLIIENEIGRKLRKNEVVHHINGDKTDNRRSNLLLCTRKEHKMLHAQLEAIAMAMVRCGKIVFVNGQYALP